MTIFGIEISDKIYLPIFIVLGAYVLDMIINKILSLRIVINKNLTKHEQRSRETVLMMCKNIIKVLIAIIAILYILQVYGVNTSALVAGVGAFSLVIGLAFQDIVRDLLAGVAILFDNKYAVGDTVSINGFQGTVIEFGLRTTKIKAFTGEVKSIGNSSFSEVINYNLSNCDIFLKLNVAYNTDIDKLEKVLESMREDILKIENVKDYKLLGVDELGDSSIVYAVDITCKAMTNYAIKREVLKMIKKKFDREGINIPYTTVDVNIRK